MNIDYKLALLIAVGWLALAAEGSAQMFGARSVGTPISRRTPPSSTPSTVDSDASLRGARLRQNRSLQDFRGSRCAREMRNILWACWAEVSRP